MEVVNTTPVNTIDSLPIDNAASAHPPASSSAAAADCMADIDPSTFKAALPPRKRAKTQEEKEQRKIERILRNRRAAHASREKKRKHVEYMEVYVVKLEENIKRLQLTCDCLLQKLPIEEQGKFCVELDDLTELKNQIHLNMKSSRRGCKKDLLESLVDEFEEHDDEDDDVDANANEKEKDAEKDQDQDQDQDQNSNVLKQVPGQDKGKVEAPLHTRRVQQLDTVPVLKKRRLSREAETKVSFAPLTTNSLTTTSVAKHPSPQPPVQVKIETITTPSTSLKPEVVDDTFFNYLSPISLNSSANSPMDITYTQACPNTVADHLELDFGLDNFKQDEYLATINSANTISSSSSSLPLSDSAIAENNTNERKNNTTRITTTAMNQMKSPLSVTGSHLEDGTVDSPTMNTLSTSNSDSPISNTSNLSLYETGQNSAVILSLEQERQQPMKTLVDILNIENRINLAITV